MKHVKSRQRRVVVRRAPSGRVTASASQAASQAFESDDEDDEDEPSEAAMSDRWSGVLVSEGELTGDGRLIEAGALRWENLPLPLLWVRESGMGHEGSVVVGRITSMERQGADIVAEGDFDLESEAGREARRQVEKGLMPGVSVDLDDADVEIRLAKEIADEVFGEPIEDDEDVEVLAVPAGEPEPEFETDDEGRVTVAKFGADDEVMVTTDARIRAATIVSIPAFINARLQVLASEDDACPEGMKQDEDGNCVEIEPDETGEETPTEKQQAKSKRKREEHRALAAAASPVAPPVAWFQDPGLTEPTALTVTDEGRVFGHLAAWGTCHTGFSECVTPPTSDTAYAYFRVGAVRTAEGTEVPVGRITQDTLHAGRRLNAVDTLAHYEHTGNAVADVACGEDAHGIWVAGALRPGLSDEDVRVLRASPLSGDWRRVGASLELVAALAVNSPGFPIPRPKAMVASGSVNALQSAGALGAGHEDPDGFTEEDRAILASVVARERRERQRLARQADSARRRVLVSSSAEKVRRARRG